MGDLIRLNLGCGQVRLPGFIGVDNNPNATAADIVHDLNCFPYPFADNSVGEVIMNHVLEHLDSPIKLLIELYRICADGAKIRACNKIKLTFCTGHAKIKAWR
ncbi:class I SAM-dependent methyltransferase, partial [Candidatus Hakubella thermalkaliphila]